MIHNIGIIGGGISGLYTLKYLLENNINNIKLFEKDSECGGIWNYKKDKFGGVLKHTHASSSVYYMHPSDFPYPDSTPLFPHHTIVNNHYKKYIEAFDLNKYIQYNSEVISLEKDNSLWIVTLKSNKKYIFKNIIIAIGTASYPSEIPSLYNKFTGDVYHSHYFNDKEYKNKRILIVGGGETGSDIATELCNDNKVYMAIKDGIWFQDRIFGANFPTDMLYNRFVHNCFTKNFINIVIGKNVESIWGTNGHGVKIWETKVSGFLNSFYNKCRDITQWIAQGKIIPKKKILSIENKLVKFDDNEELEIDIIILAIGYKPIIPFLKYKMNFDYLHIFDPNDTSICTCGFIRPYVASIPMLIEFQAELIALYYSQQINLPDYENMKSDIEKSRKKQLKEFRKDAIRLTKIVDPFDYANKLSKISKTKCNSLYLLLNNPSLWFKYVFNPYTLFSYRLTHSNIIKRHFAIKYMYKYDNNEVSIRARYISLALLLIFYIIPILSFLFCSIFF